MIRGVELSRGDLESAADGERETIVQAKSAKHKTRREIYRGLARVAGGDNISVSAVKVVKVDFQFRPKFLVDSVLQRVIPRQSVSDDRHVSGRQAPPNVPWTAKFPKPFP